MDEILALIKRIEDYGCSCEVMLGFQCTIHSLISSLQDKLKDLASSSPKL